jgi:hypothetical protein
MIIKGKEALYNIILRHSPNNTDFDYFVKVVKKFGFEKIERKKSGSHSNKFTLFSILSGIRDPLNPPHRGT